MPSPVIAIDGPAGSGKSTTAAAVAERLGLAHLDSGSLYRAATLAAIDASLPLSGQQVVALALSLPVRLGLFEMGFRPEVAGVDVSEEIRSDRVTASVSQVSALPEVRDWVNASLREAARHHPRGVVMDGRDIGTVVFPDAVLKIFLTAEPAARAERRLRQVGREPMHQGAVEQEADELMRRDRLDSSRAVAPLACAEDAVVLDTTRLTFVQQVERVVELARKLFP